MRRFLATLAAIPSIFAFRNNHHFLSRSILIFSIYTMSDAAQDEYRSKREILVESFHRDGQNDGVTDKRVLQAMREVQR